MFNWSEIDTVLLDMDGTLLDLHFDNYFWLEYVPQCYAEKHGMSLQQAKQTCGNKNASVAGTLNWYCVDYWSKEFDLDIARLKAEVSHLIEVLPHAVDFLDLLASAGKRRILVTNAHQKSLALKMQKTQLNHRLDELICSHEFGLAKENPAFWGKLQQRLPFDKERTLFIDDSLSVLRSAQAYGIKHLLEIRYPDRQQAIREPSEFMSIIEFDEVTPSLKASLV